MTSIRRPWWAALVLAALASGCSNEPGITGKDGTTNTPTPAETSPAPGPAPVTTPASAEPSASGGMKAEMRADPAAPAPAASEPAKSDSATEPKLEGPKSDSAPKADATKSAAAGDVKLSDEEVAEIKKLPAGEQTLALKQAVCPVSDEHLGAMGTPIKVTAEGKTFYLCCKGCKDEVEKNAKDVVAKLPSKK